MDFSLTPRQEAFRAELRAFLERQQAELFGRAGLSSNSVSFLQRSPATIRTPKCCSIAILRLRYMRQIAVRDHVLTRSIFWSRRCVQSNARVDVMGRRTIPRSLQRGLFDSVSREAVP